MHQLHSSYRHNLNRLNWRLVLDCNDFPYVPAFNHHYPESYTPYLPPLSGGMLAPRVFACDNLNNLSRLDALYPFLLGILPTPHANPLTWPHPAIYTLATGD